MCENLLDQCKKFSKKTQIKSGVNIRNNKTIALASKWAKIERPNQPWVSVELPCNQQKNQPSEFWAKNWGKDKHLENLEPSGSKAIKC